MKIIERNVQQIGKSFLITLPKGWIKALGVKKGASLKIMTNEQGNLSIAPDFIHASKHTEALITFGEHFRREFFKEYFSQREKIIIRLEKDISNKNKSDIYSFLSRFMNVQVIEESAQAIIVKSFVIQELSIEECLKRMHLLSLNMLDEVKQSTQEADIQEIRNTMTRFYYMLIMQVRRFLSEGIFTESNQISIIRALDVRMAAEKMQRIGELLSSLAMIDKDVQSLLIDFDVYYTQAGRCFLESNFEKALPLWNHGNNLQNKLNKIIYRTSRRKETEAYGQLIIVSQMIRLAKEISMLVR